MICVVTKMREQGRALSTRDLHSDANAIKGDIVVVMKEVRALGRQALVAEIQKYYAHQPDPLPPLIDVRLAHMSGRGFVLQGYELSDDGSQAYAQGWWCRDASI